MTEIEVKLRVAGADVARAAVARLGAVLAWPRHFEDNLLLDDARGSLREAGSVLRLRRTPAGGFLTFKGPRYLEEGLKSREEVEAPVADADALQAVLERLGFRSVFRYQKYRETYAWRGQEIVIDETPIGTFFEIEGDVAGIQAAAGSLGYRPADYLTDSYVGLFFAGGGRGDMVFSK
ncbi:MAG TPA: class IV adenylate cyclase [Vicinamibacteria bacterium]|jgi:adenylate cyclase class 2|nr:class IV adenylate cyclase [Vicinamibacteria bacterium]